MTWSARSNSAGGTASPSCSAVPRLTTSSKPADLPIEQPTSFELVVNRGTAEHLGLAVPPALLLRADHVID